MMDERTVSPNAIRALSRARAAHDQIVTPENDQFIRDLVGQALAGIAGVAPPPWAAEAWALLADVLVSDYLHRWNNAGQEELRQAVDAVGRALAIDDQLPLAYYVKGFVERAEGRHEDALTAFDRAIVLDPNFARAFAQKGNELVNLGRPGEAPILVQRAIELSPFDPSLGMFYWIVGRAYFFAGFYQDAIPWLEKSVEARPTVWYNWIYLVGAHALLGDIGAAGTVLADFGVAFPGYTLGQVIRNEKANPNDHGTVVSGRAKLHEGLLSAGLDPNLEMAGISI